MSHTSNRTQNYPDAAHRPNRFVALVFAVALAAAAGIGAAATFATSASAATAPVGLGGAADYSVVGGSTVTNTGPSVLSGSLGLSPGSAITGFPPGLVGGDTHAADADASGVQSAIVNGWTVSAGRAPNALVAGDMVGRTLTPGVYKSTSSLHLSGTLTLNAQGNPASVFIFQIASTLITSTSSKVVMVNGAQACNVFWQVGSSATLGVTSVFKGTIMALTSITVNTGATVEGRALAHNGAVTLDDNVFTTPGCNTGSGGGTSSSSAATTSASTTGGGTSAGGGTSGGTSGGTTGGTSGGTSGGTGTTGTETTPGGVVVTTPGLSGVGVPPTGSSGTSPLTATTGATSTTNTSASTRPHTPLTGPRFPAKTGSNALAILILGGGLVLLGGTALLVGRRMRSYPHLH